MSTSANVRIALSLFLGVSLVYAAISRGVFLYGDDVLVYQVTESIVERGAFDVSTPPDRGDATRSIPGDDGRNYAKYGIGLSLVAIPGFAVGTLIEPLLPLKVVGDDVDNPRSSTRIYVTALTNAVIGGATVALLFLLAVELGLTRRTAIALAGLLAFATLLLHYSATFLTEPLSALCLTATVYGLVMSRRDSLRGRAVGWLALSGFAAGLALATKLANGATLVAPALWLLWLAVGEFRRRGMTRAILTCIAWGLPILIWASAVGWYNAARFGKVTSTGYREEASSYTTPLYEGVYGLLLSPGKGVLWYNLPLLLALAGCLMFYRRFPALALTILGMLLGTLLLYGRYYIWWGGGVWGTRFLVPLLPLLLLPAGYTVERASPARRLVKGVVLGIISTGLLVTALGVLVPYNLYLAETLGDPARFHASLWDVSSSPIVAHVRLLDDTLGSPDIAAQNYGSPALLGVSLVLLLAGLILLVDAVRRVLRDDMETGRASRPSP